MSGSPLFWPDAIEPRALGACPICSSVICGHGGAQRLSAALDRATYERPDSRELSQLIEAASPLV